MASSGVFGKFTEGVAQCIQRGGYDEQRGGTATIEDVWAVLLPPGGRPVASNIVNLPKMGDAAGGSGSGVFAKMFVSSIKWRQRGEHSRVWEATVSYSRGSSKAASQGSAEAKYWDKRWSSRVVQADLTADAVDGRAVVNSAGEPFDSVPQRDMFAPVVSFTMLTSVTPATLAQYQGTINAAAVTVLGIAFAAHCARLTIECRQLDPEEVDGVAKYEYQITIEGASTPYSATAPADGSAPLPADVEDIGWDVSALDCGYCYRAENDALVPILLPDENGEMKRPQSPVPLDGAGAVANTDPDLHFLKFSAYAEATWPDYLTPAS